MVWNPTPRPATCGRSTCRRNGSCPSAGRTTSGDGRHGPCGPVLGDPRGHPQRGRTEGAARIGAGERRPPPGDRGLEPGLHAVRPQGRRQPGTCPPGTWTPAWASSACAWCCRGNSSNYDTDVFQPLIQALAKRSGRVYGQGPGSGAGRQGRHRHARVRRPPAGHRLAIADGQLPGNTGRVT